MTSSGAARFLPGLVAVAMMSGASTASAQSFWYRHGIPGIGAFSAPPTEPCGESPYPGQVCADGSIYAGLSPDGDIAMYVAASSAPSTLLWSSEDAIRGTNSEVDGDGNTSTLDAPVEVAHHAANSHAAQAQNIAKGRGGENE